MKQFTDDQLITRIWDKEQIKDLMSRWAYNEANEHRSDSLEKLWVSDPQLQQSASFGRNWGYYVGMDDIRRYYVDDHNKALKQQLEAISAADPKIENNEENLGYGNLSFHTMSTPLIYISDDGATARGKFYSIGQDTNRLPGNDAEEYWRYESLTADFVRETDGWKIWHLFICHDAVAFVAESFHDQEVYFPDEKNPVYKEFGTPTIPFDAHDEQFHWADGYPPLPTAFETYDPLHGYGPEGHPKYQKEARA